MRLTLVLRETARPGLAVLRDSDKEAFAASPGLSRPWPTIPYPDGAVPWGGSGYYRLHAEDAGAVYVLNVGLVPRSR